MPSTGPHGIDVTDACWRKSSYSGGANDCVELAEVGYHVAVRDSKNPRQSPLVFTRSEAAALVSALKTGAFGVPTMPGR
ncbi:DUF397 domain-containing protein [Streptomyces lonegramiae]|uniref:DUF397 domain-containing protein n=1 Tax=Streptomyces lonegramiae TaxID=3075524 RepID=A0ABU2XP41_9ACTN|nr:DUF397 domain-containing protein [Streptomyces sp. DSM 41529]MDT0547699.1 DUF397 domain-containing protein [Streptomyces sp. DSM 41529]